MIKTKKYEEYKSTDIRNYWCEVYFGKNKTHYQVHSTGGNELALIKALFEMADIYVILLSIDDAINKNVRDIRYFVQNFQKYNPKFSDYSKLQFYVGHFGDEKQKKNWLHLTLCFSKWVPDIETQKRQKQLIKEIEEWIEKEYGS